MPSSSEESISFDVDNESFKSSKGRKLAGVTLNTDIGFHMHVTYINRTKFTVSDLSYYPFVWVSHNRELNNRIKKLQERALRFNRNKHQH